MKLNLKDFAIMQIIFLMGIIIASLIFSPPLAGYSQPWMTWLEIFIFSVVCLGGAAIFYFHRNSTSMSDVVVISLFCEAILVVGWIAISLSLVVLNIPSASLVDSKGGFIFGVIMTLAALNTVLLTIPLTLVMLIAYGINEFILNKNKRSVQK